MTGDRIVLALFVAAFTVAAAAWDWRTRRLPNWLTVSAFAVGLLFHVGNGWIGSGLRGAAQGGLFSLAGFATGFGVLLILWLIGSGGGGDVKFMGALGAWLGAFLTVQVFVVSAVLVVVGVVAMWVWDLVCAAAGPSRQQAVLVDGTSGTSQSAATARPVSRRSRQLVPFGVPAALATWIVLVAAELARLMSHS